MTTPAPDCSGLIERLERLKPVPTNPYGRSLGQKVNPDGPEAARAIRDLEAERERLRSDLDAAYQNVCAFAAPWAAQYARDHGLPDGHLHPVHYDILEKAGSRMVAFTRTALSGTTTAGEAGTGALSGRAET